MRLVVGLGNPGEKYRFTRHNLGYMVVDKFIRDKTSKEETEKGWKNDKYGNSLKFSLGIELDQGVKEEIILIKPQTFMNASGEAVSYYLRKLKLMPEDIIVINDDVDLPLGKIRIRKGGASAGHRGVQSIIDLLKSPEFIRLRLGVGRGKEGYRKGVEKFVLSRFSQTDAGEFKTMIKKASRILEELLEEGLEKVSNKYN